MWEEYTVSASGIVYLVDIADSTRFEESKIALHKIMDNEKFSLLPILILANKIDLPAARSVEELAGTLNL